MYTYRTERSVDAFAAAASYAPIIPFVEKEKLALKASIWIQLIQTGLFILYYTFVFFVHK